MTQSTKLLYRAQVPSDTLFLNEFAYIEILIFIDRCVIRNPKIKETITNLFIRESQTIKLKFFVIVLDNQLTSLINQWKRIVGIHRYSINKITQSLQQRFIVFIHQYHYSATRLLIGTTNNIAESFLRTTIFFSSPYITFDFNIVHQSMLIAYLFIHLYPPH